MGSKYVLGIVDSQNDCGACLVKNGKLVGAINEERIKRKKLVGGFPTKSIEELLRANNLGYKDIETIVVAGFCTPPFFARKFRFLQKAEYGVRKNKRKKVVKNLSDIAQGKFKIQTSKPESLIGIISKKLIKNIIKRDLPKGLQNKQVVFVNHHLSHAASAYYTQNKNKVLAITADGCGDGVSFTVNICKDGNIKSIHNIDAKHSYGWFYGLITMALGFQWHKHEGKVTGLAARGNAANVRLRFPFESKNGEVRYFGSHMPSKVKKLISKYKKEDVAAWVQRGLEDHVRKTVRYWVKKTGVGHVVLAGGLFANVKLNQEIHEIKEVESVWVFPHMGDGGLAVGSVLSYASPESKPIDNIYLGTEFTDKEIRKELDREKIEYYKPRNQEKEVARHLSKGKVVARFEGRMEYGPRALGNRSILYTTRDKKVNEWLNKKLQRTEFMPFAPTTLWEYRNECYKNIKGAEEAAKFMTVTFDCTEKMKKQSPGVIHIDGTARPQLIRREDNKKFYDIIKEYYKMTGIPSIINTSFNIHEEPIVNNPREAIKAFKQSKLDHLSIGSFITK